MKSGRAILQWIPAVIAASSMISLYAFSQIDTIVHKTLYNYHLQFSYEWANPYWTMAYVAIAMGWLIAGLGIAFQVYLLFGRTPLKNDETELLSKREENIWNTFKLGDGSTIRVKLVVKRSKAVEQVFP